ERLFVGGRTTLFATRQKPVLVPGGTSTFREFLKRQKDGYFPRHQAIEVGRIPAKEGRYLSGTMQGAKREGQRAGAWSEEQMAKARRREEARGKLPGFPRQRLICQRSIQLQKGVLSENDSLRGC